MQSSRKLRTAIARYPLRSAHILSKLNQYLRESVLRAFEVGVKTVDLCRKHGISEQRFYNWKAKYGGLEISEAKRLKGQESENPS